MRIKTVMFQHKMKLRKFHVSHVANAHSKIYRLFIYKGVALLKNTFNMYTKVKALNKNALTVERRGITTCPRPNAA